MYNAVKFPSSCIVHYSWLNLNEICQQFTLSYFLCT